MKNNIYVRIFKKENGEYTWKKANYLEMCL